MKTLIFLILFALTFNLNAQKVNKVIDNTINITGDITYKFAHVKAHIDSVVGYTVGSTQNVFYKINPGTLIIVDTLGIKVQGDSAQIWLYAGTYEIIPVVAATTSNANDQLRVKLYKNNSPFSPALENFVIGSNGAGARETHTIPWYVKGLNKGDWLSFRIQNQTGARAITITDFGFYIKKVQE